MAQLEATIYKPKVSRFLALLLGVVISLYPYLCRDQRKRPSFFSIGFPWDSSIGFSNSNLRIPFIACIPPFAKLEPRQQIPGEKARNPVIHGVVI